MYTIRPHVFPLPTATTSRKPNKLSLHVLITGSVKVSFCVLRLIPQDNLSDPTTFWYQENS